ncbi:MAG: TIGR01440 family protein [Acetomicrobium sp.]
MEIGELTSSVHKALSELLSIAELKPENILVVGCSTSEVLGKKIGSASNLEVAKAIMEGIEPLVEKSGLFLAVQCCEHLNRALVVEEDCAMKYHLEVVTVLPHLEAGGALAVLAYEEFAKPVVVENIQGHAGVDIGDTMIGMHLKRVAVPVRREVKRIGEANLVMARTRPKLIGGERAKYPPYYVK